jgi:peroxiredoxin
MRKVFVFLGVLAFLSSCTSDTTYEISVNTDGKLADKAYLIKTVERQQVVFDSAQWKDGFVFKGNVEFPELVHFQLDGGKEKVSFFLENGTYTVQLDTQPLAIATIKGSEPNSLYLSFLDSAKRFTDKNQAMYAGYQKAQQEQDTVALDSIKIVAEQLYEAEQTMAKQFAKANLDNVAGIFVVRSKLVYTMNYDDLNAFLSEVPQDRKNNPYYTYLNEHLQKLAGTRVGKTAPDFTMKDTAGNDISLSDFRGHYTMIDFWASWCGPCRRANPFVVEIYNDFKDKGFRILGVSFDQSRDAWIKAIHDDEITWTHVSDLKVWDNAAGKIYGVNSIPHTVLIDPDGKIVANRFEHEELREKLEEIYK